MKDGVGGACRRPPGFRHGSRYAGARRDFAFGFNMRREPLLKMPLYGVANDKNIVNPERVVIIPVIVGIKGNDEEFE